MQKIAFIDSGIGGLSIYYSMITKYPNGYDYTYIADNAMFPYGTKSTAFIKSRVSSLLAYLVRSDYQLAVLACNTITTTAIDYLRSTVSIPIVGTEPAIKPAIQNQHKIIVLATSNTISSQRTADLCHQIECTLIAADQLVSAIESQDDYQIRHILHQTLDQHAFPKTSLVLACTHFIHVISHIHQEYPDVFDVFEPTAGVVAQISKLLPPTLGVQRPISILLTKPVIDQRNIYRHMYKPHNIKVEVSGISF